MKRFAFVWTCLGGCLALALSGTSFASTPETIAIDLGLTPQALACAGASPSDAEQLLANVAGATEEVAGWTAAVPALTTANENLASLYTAMTEGANPPSSEDVAAAQAAIITAKQQLSSAIAALREAALAGFASGAQTKIDAFIASSGRRVPDEFRVLTLSDGEWDALEAALIEERRSIRLDIDLSTPAATLLSTTRALADVQAASLASNQTLTAIEAIMAAE